MDDNVILPFTEEELKQQKLLLIEEEKYYKEYQAKIKLANIKWNKLKTIKIEKKPSSKKVKFNFRM